MATRIPAALRQLFSRPPIMAGESAADYAELLELAIGDVEPRVLQEWLLMKDIVDAEWELLRLRGLKVSMLHAVIPRVVTAELAEEERPASVNPTLLPLVRKHIIGILAGDEQAHRELENLLQAQNLTLAATTALAFERNIVPQLHTDRMIGTARDRRNAAYAEITALRFRKESSTRPSQKWDAEQDADVDEQPVPNGSDVANGGPNTSHDGSSDNVTRQH
jgi:hypothetical protein